MTTPVLPPLPDEVARALPASTPPPPSTVRVDAALWWHARVVVDGDGLPPWLQPGRRLGAVLTGARLVVGPPR